MKGSDPGARIWTTDDGYSVAYNKKLRGWIIRDPETRLKRDKSGATRTFATPEAACQFAARLAAMSSRRSGLQERNFVIFLEHLNGETFRAIGRQHGLSHSRAGSICRKVAKRMDRWTTAHLSAIDARYMLSIVTRLAAREFDGH